MKSNRITVHPLSDRLAGPVAAPRRQLGRTSAGALLVAVSIAMALIAAACGSGSEDISTATQASAATEAASSDAEVAPATDGEATGAESTGGEAGDASPSATSEGELLGPNTSAWARNAGALPPEQRNGIYGEAPAMTIDPAGIYQATIATEKGEMAFELFAANAPITVNNFVNLATDGFYDGVSFHRVIDSFMAQGGDPTGIGNGGPGYQFVNEYTPGIEFGDRGIIAMANAGPNTNGSQFFITFDDAGFLPASDYTVFGRITTGDDALSSIRMRDPGSDPLPGDLITGVTIRKVG